MNKIKNLNEIVGRQLGGLQATDKMLLNIQRKAAQANEKPVMRLRPVLAVCMAALLCIGGVSWLWAGGIPGQPAPSPSVLDSRPAGSESQPEGANGAENAALSLGRVSIGQVVDKPAYHSIFVEAQGSNFPVVLIDREAYRMLKTPAEVHQSLLAETLGQVTEYTLEPALSNGGVVSNAIRLGENVYVVEGMRGAMVAANVNGAMRAFQRVSFAGSAVIGNESLVDTLSSVGRVTSLELSDVGTIRDAAVAQSLMRILLEAASYQSASVSPVGSQSLIIGLDSGLALQMMVSGDSVSACGTWSCPEFFEAFAQALE